MTSPAADPNVYGDILGRMVTVNMRIQAMEAPPDAAPIADLLEHLAAARLIHPDMPDSVYTTLRDAASQDVDTILPVVVAIYEYINENSAEGGDCPLPALLQLIDDGNVLPAQLMPIYRAVCAAPNNEGYLRDLDGLFVRAREVLRGCAERG